MSILAVAVTLTGCGHYAMRGSVVERESANEAQVCLGDHEVGIGDKVVLYKAVCVGPPATKSGTRACNKERIGAGVVTRTLNEHMSIIQVDPGVEFKEGTIAEKQ